MIAGSNATGWDEVGGLLDWRNRSPWICRTAPVRIDCCRRVRENSKREHFKTSQTALCCCQAVALTGRSGMGEGVRKRGRT